MKVILLEKFKKLGDAGSVVEVKSGFARNYLLPNNIAAQATRDNIAYFESKKAEITAKSSERAVEAEKCKSSINAKVVSVIKQAGEDGRLYGAVSATDIAEKVNEIASAEITRKNVVINTPIKAIGVYKIVVELGEGVQAEIFANVARGEAEAEDIATKFQAGELELGSLVATR